MEEPSIFSQHCLLIAFAPLAQSSCGLEGQAGWKGLAGGSCRVILAATHRERKSLGAHCYHPLVTVPVWWPSYAPRISSLFHRCAAHHDGVMLGISGFRKDFFKFLNHFVYAPTTEVGDVNRAAM